MIAPTSTLSFFGLWMLGLLCFKPRPRRPWLVFPSSSSNLSCGLSHIIKPSISSRLGRPKLIPKALALIKTHVESLPAVKIF
ncbi:hypothetical protein B0H14DRAFT_2740349 [Mycena olivaceomarginata]|nr:hypothetical protein B0H14DRAFT_2740349 [Mycena olivaceomarginata]